MSEAKVAVVTGVSSGIGRSVALLLAEQGATVFGTSRNPSGVETMTGVTVLPLDVRLDESVTACVDAVLKQVGRLDILVNNAGYELGGAIEEASLEEAQAQFETNFWGGVRMVKAALPVMRRQGDGQIINIGSLAGVVAVPFTGYYCASKFALEGYTEALRHEVMPLNIRVSLVEPLAVNTRYVLNSQTAIEQIRDYTPWRERFGAFRRRAFQKAAEPAVVARCVQRIVDDEKPKARYQPGPGARTLFLARRFLPASVFEGMWRRVMRLDAKDLAMRGDAQTAD